MINRCIYLLPVFMLFIFPACSQQEDDASQVIEKKFQIIKNAQKLKLKKVSVPSFYVTSGTVTSDHQVTIRSRISGYILKLSVREGDSIRKGQVLVYIDAADAKQRLIQAEADMSNVAADLHRYESLYKDHAISLQQLEKFRLNFKVSKSQVELARNQLTYTKVRSPVDGVVVEKRLNKGDLAQPGATILVLEDPSNLLIETYISEQFISGIHEGDNVEVMIQSLKRNVSGVVRQVVEAADPISHQFLVKIALSNDPNIHPGMFSEVRFEIGVRNVLLVPSESIIERAGLHGIYIADARKIIHYHQVRLGVRMKNNIEILSGLHEGDEIVWGAHSRLKTGMKISNDIVE